MQKTVRGLAAILVLCLLVPPAFALSRSLLISGSGPDINFPKDYDKKRGEQIVTILSDKRLVFQGGLVSYWPPDWGTTLVYTGDTEALDALFVALQKVKGLHVAVSFSNEPPSSKRYGANGSWLVQYRQTRPDLLSIVVNVKSEKVDLEKLHLPEWKGL